MINPTTKQDAMARTKAIMQTLSDKMEVGIAKIRGEDYAELDVAILKATLHDEVVPKEKHVRTLVLATKPTASRQQVNYVITTLAKRLDPAEKHGWLTTLKALVVFHRLMRDGDHTFQDEMIRHSDRTGTHRLLRLDSFADHTTKETWDYSAWIRVYSVYLDERLSVFRTTKFDPEQESTREGVDSRLKACSGPEILDQLPMLQKLLTRVVACLPEGAAAHNVVVLQACGMVLKELSSIYKAVSEGVLNLVDKFFEMDRSEASKGLQLYKENQALNDKLNAYFAAIHNSSALRSTVQFPTLQSLPSDFTTTMEDYVKDAPKLQDPNAPTSRRIAGMPVSDMRVSTLAARGGTTSSAIQSGLQLTPPPPPSVVAGPGPYQPAPAPAPMPVAPAPVLAPAPPPPPSPVDLLDFDSVGLTPAAPSQNSGVAISHQQHADPFGNGSFGGGATAHWQPQVPAHRGSAGTSQSPSPFPVGPGGAVPLAGFQANSVVTAQQPGYGAPVPGHAPQQAGGFPPQQTGGHVPQQGVYTTQHTGGYAPQQAGGYVLQPAGGFAPQQTGSYAPQQTGSYAPQQTGSYAPQQTGGFAPQQTGGYAPQQTGGYAPQQTGYAPQQTGYPTQHAQQPGFTAQQVAGFNQSPTAANPFGADSAGTGQPSGSSTAPAPSAYSLKPRANALDALDLFGRANQPVQPPPSLRDLKQSPAPPA